MLRVTGDRDTSASRSVTLGGCLGPAQEPMRHQRRRHSRDKTCLARIDLIAHRGELTTSGGTNVLLAQGRVIRASEPMGLTQSAIIHILAGAAHRPG